MTGPANPKPLGERLKEYAAQEQMSESAKERYSAAEHERANLSARYAAAGRYQPEEGSKWDGTPTYDGPRGTIRYPGRAVCGLTAEEWLAAVMQTEGWPEEERALRCPNSPTNATDHACLSCNPRRVLELQVAKHAGNATGFVPSTRLFSREEVLTVLRSEYWRQKDNGIHDAALGALSVVLRIFDRMQ